MTKSEAKALSNIILNNFCYIFNYIISNFLLVFNSNEKIKKIILVRFREKRNIEGDKVKYNPNKLD